jgi:hypothetical protein
MVTDLITISGVHCIGELATRVVDRLIDLHVPVRKATTHTNF